MSYTTFETLENGNLKISLTEEGKEYVLDNHKHTKDENGCYEFESNPNDMFLDLIEYQLCNGYRMVKPKDIRALTDANIISDTLLDEETTKEEAETANVWYFEQYAIYLEICELMEKGYIIFTKA